MPKIIAFTGSNSKTSINDQLLKFTLQLFQSTEVEYIDLKPLEVPIYSIDIENSTGIPKDIIELKSSIEKSDAIVVAVNEHNGTMSAFFKNITDWLSRTDGKYLANKSIFLLATSPGGGGAKFCLEYTTRNFEKFGGDVVQKFSLPLFSKHFVNGGLIEEYDAQLKSLVSSFENELK